MDADGPAPKVLLADNGYDADIIRQDMEKRAPRRSSRQRNRLIQLPVDADIYALRNLVERCFNKLKNARRLATRYDKTADSYLGFVHIVSIRLWMREFVLVAVAWRKMTPRIPSMLSDPTVLVLM